jgi:hypothetical protein
MGKKKVQPYGVGKWQSLTPMVDKIIKKDTAATFAAGALCTCTEPCAPDTRPSYCRFNADPEPPDTKPTNPKDIIGSSKLPLHLWPATASAMGCIGLLEGMLKYGRQNWRPSGVRASIYVDACKRHLDAWFEGEDHAPDSGVPHLANALACLAILVDAQAAGVLNDDRAYPGGYRSLVESLTPHVARLQALHADRSPKHWGIGDAP